MKASIRPAIQGENSRLSILAKYLRVVAQNYERAATNQRIMNDDGENVHGYVIPQGNLPLSQVQESLKVFYERVS